MQWERWERRCCRVKRAKKAACGMRSFGERNFAEAEKWLLKPWLPAADARHSGRAIAGAGIAMPAAPNADIALFAGGDDSSFGSRWMTQRHVADRPFAERSIFCSTEPTLAANWKTGASALSRATNSSICSYCRMVSQHNVMNALPDAGTLPVSSAAHAHHAGPATGFAGQAAFSRDDGLEYEDHPGQSRALTDP